MKRETFIRKLENLGIKHFLSGSNIMLSCPFHEDKHPSLGVDFSKGVFNCFSCGASGKITKLFDAIFEGKKEDFEEDLSKIDRGDQITEVKKKIELVKILKEEPLKIKILVNFKLGDFRFPFNGIYPEYGNYLKSRKITPHTARKWNMRSGEWRGAPRIIIPMYDEYKRLIAIYGRSIIDDKDLRIRKSKGADVGKILFGLEHILGKVEEALLVEGEFDAIYMQQFHFPALSLGTKRPTEIQLMKMAKYFKRVFLSLDGDVPLRSEYRNGNKILGLMEIQEEILQYLACEVIKLPSDMDPNDLSKQDIEEIYSKTPLWRYYNELG